MNPVHRLSVNGLVQRPGLYDLSALDGLCQPAGRFIRMVDVLARVRLLAAAEVLVATSADGASMAVPVRDVLGDAWLALDDDGTVALAVLGWSADGRPFPVVSLHAVTFAWFLGLPASADRADAA